MFGADGYVASINTDDAASAVVAALQAPPGIYNVSDEPVTRQQYYAALGGRARPQARPGPAVGDGKGDGLEVGGARSFTAHLSDSFATRQDGRRSTQRYERRSQVVAEMGGTNGSPRGSGIVLLGWPSWGWCRSSSVSGHRSCRSRSMTTSPVVGRVGSR